MSVQWPIILGSRSPRRLELLSKLVDPKRVEVLPSSDEAEQGFEDVFTRTDFADRICEIVQAKEANVLEQLKARHDFRDFFLLTCDTTVIGTKADGRLVALGQPTETEWQQTVREWFLNYYAGRTHSVMSCMSLSRVTDSAVQRETSVCETRVTMRNDIEPELDWYIASNESPGKAGGYAIQGLASTFVSRLEGSFTNVVGLPLENTLQLLRQARAI